MRIAPIQPVARRMYTSLTPSTIHEPAEKWRMLRDDLLSRRLPLTYDYLTPQPSHLLNLTLADLNPRFHASDETLPSIERLRPLPIGHHSVYFPTQLPLSRLLPDGTDDLHSPGKPFTRRLWARGAVRWSPSAGLWLTGKRAVCLETIRDVTGKVHEKHPTIERIGIHLERRIGTVHEDETEESIRNRLFRENSEEFGDAAIIETRDILFLKTKSQESIDSEKWNPSAPKFIKPPSGPELNCWIRPSKAALFRFSALTFNAHLIHIDPAYTQNVEGYRNPLVHGPLTLVLMLSALQSHLLKRMLVIQEIRYKNLLPCFVDENIKICAKPLPGNKGLWAVWIENEAGSCAVSGTVTTSSMI